jgi:hypothetical protein
MTTNLPTPVRKSTLLSDANYDRLKFLAQIVLPALATFYAGLALIWGLPDSTQVVGTVVAIDTLLGTFLGLSTMVYNAQPLKFDGNLEINETESKIVHQLELTTPPEELADKQAIILKVTKNPMSLVSPYPEENLK